MMSASEQPTDPRGTEAGGDAGFRQRAEVDAVLALLLSRVNPLPVECVSVSSAAGRVLKTALTSPSDMPPFDRSAMDGYAVRGEDTFGATSYGPVELVVVGESLPGAGFGGRVREGEAVRIFTGAPVPEGANAVLMVEYTRTERRDQAEFLQMVAAVPPGKHVSRRGEDVERGSDLLPAGRVLRPQDLGVLSSVGVSEVSVVRTPLVDVVPTGDELLPAGSRPEGHRIVDSNTPMLAALVRRDGAEPKTHPICEDRFDAIRERLQSCQGDAILITGGSSVGREDHVPEVVRDLGELAVHGVALRPSSPAGVGFIDDRPVFLLPGNPVSCLCAYDFFAGPALRRCGGRSSDWPHATRDLKLTGKLTSQTGRVDYARVRIVDDGVEPVLVSGASILSSTTRADGFVIVSGDVEGIEAGETVTVYLYG